MATPERFIVMAEGGTDALAADLIERPAQMLARTFELLHHTPVAGVGHNFSFALTEEPPPASWLGTLLTHAARPPVPTGGASMFHLQVRFQGVIPGAAVAVTFLPGDPRKQLSFNVHRVVGSSQEAVEAAKRGAADLDAVRAWITQLNLGASPA